VIPNKKVKVTRKYKISDGIERGSKFSVAQSSKSKCQNDRYRNISLGIPNQKYRK
jgi:hypothetical protein